MTSTKCCTRCKQEKPIECFGIEKSKKNGRKFCCLECARIRNRLSYQKNREKRIASSIEWKRANQSKDLDNMRKYRARLKAKIVEAYGGKCTCCGEAEMTFLTLEHLNGGGRQHRGTRGAHGAYRDVIAQGFPPEYTVLCMNCNHGKRFGACPHEVARAALAQVAP